MHKLNTRRMSCLDGIANNEMSVYANVATSGNGEAEWKAQETVLVGLVTNEMDRRSLSRDR
jgi:hypothetical protein